MAPGKKRPLPPVPLEKLLDSLKIAKEKKDRLNARYEPGAAYTEEDDLQMDQINKEVRDLQSKISKRQVKRS